MKPEISNIGKIIEQLMNEKNISVRELSEKTNISKYRINKIIHLESEPYIFPEIKKILPVLGIKTLNQTIQFMNNWFDLVRK